MSMRKSMDKALTTLENSTMGIKRFYKFMKDLSFRSKANIDLQIRSKKKFHPVYRCGFNCDKEIRILPVIYAVMGIAFVMSLFCCSGKNSCDD